MDNYDKEQTSYLPFDFEDRMMRRTLFMDLHQLVWYVQLHSSCLSDYKSVRLFIHLSSKCWSCNFMVYNHSIEYSTMHSIVLQLQQYAWEIFGENAFLVIVASELAFDQVIFCGFYNLHMSNSCAQTDKKNSTVGKNWKGEIYQLVQYNLRCQYRVLGGEGRFQKTIL